MIGARRATLGAITCAVFALAACSGDEPDAAPTTPPPTTSAPTTAATIPTTSAAPPTTAPPTTVAPTTEPAPTTAPPPTPPPADTGVPGLDSEDAFCAAWSRFGGSWQVVLVAASAFGDPDDAARLEVLASTVVGDAYDALFDVWPDELTAERDVVADEFFGAFQRRSADALAALSSAGADADDIEDLAELWVDALASRSPNDPVLEVAVPDDLATVIDDAVERFTAQRTPFIQDPSMVITAETPATDSFLFAACPDQGSILGGDVIG